MVICFAYSVVSFNFGEERKFFDKTGLMGMITIPFKVKYNKCIVNADGSWIVILIQRIALNGSVFVFY